MVRVKIQAERLSADLKYGDVQGKPQYYFDDLHFPYKRPKLKRPSIKTIIRRSKKA